MKNKSFGFVFFFLTLSKILNIQALKKQNSQLHTWHLKCYSKVIAPESNLQHIFLNRCRMHFSSKCETICSLQADWKTSTPSPPYPGLTFLWLRDRETLLFSAAHPPDAFRKNLTDATCLTEISFLVQDVGEVLSEIIQLHTFGALQLEAWTLFITVCLYIQLLYCLHERFSKCRQL